MCPLFRCGLVTGLLLCFLPSLPAQDSLRQVLPGSSGMVRFELLYRLAGQTGPDSLAEALAFLAEGRKLAEAAREDRAVARALLLSGQLLDTYSRTLEERQQAVSNYLEAITYCQQAEDVACLAEAHFKAGRGYILFQESEQALHNLFKALTLYRTLNDSSGMIAATAYLGFVFQMTGSPDEAISYETQALQLAVAAGADSMRAFILLNIGTFHLERGEYQVAESYFQEALTLADALLPPRDRAIVLNRLAETMAAQSKVPRAERYLAQALALGRAEGDAYALADTYHGLAELRHQGGASQQAMTYLDSSSYFARLGHFHDRLLANYRLYQDVLLDMGNYSQFRQYRDRYEGLRDSIEGVQLRQSLLRQEVLYEKRQQEDALRIQAAELATRRVQTMFAVATGLLLFILALILYRQYQQKRKINIRLEQQVAARTRELADANEELDTFAYRTAHDFRGPVARLLGLCNLLLDDPTGPAASTYMEMLKRESVGMDHMLRRFMDVNNIKRIEPRQERVVLRELVVEVLDDLRDQEFPMNAKIDIDIEPQLSAMTHPELLRVILKNIIGNALMFRRGKGEHHVHIMARGDGNTVRVRIRDNGIGIAPAVAPRIFEMFYRGTEQSTGLGLGLFATRLAADKLKADVRYLPGNEHETVFSIVFASGPKS